MTHPTDELTRLLTGAADDIVERDRVPSPEAPVLWRRGRRTTWLARGATAVIVGMLVLTAGAMLAVVGAAPTTVPSDGSSLTYPQLVSNLFTRSELADPGPVFGLVRLPGTSPQPSSTGVIERSGALTGLPPWSRSLNVDLRSLGDPGTALAPDGAHLLTPDGIVDLTDGTLTRPVVLEGVAQQTSGSRAVWSPDSQHVATGTLQGPSVLDRFDDVVLRPLPGDAGVMIAGWRDNRTLLGVKPSSSDGAAYEVVTRGLTADRWTAVATVADDAVLSGGPGSGPVTPSAAYASPDGARVLLVDHGGPSVLLDAQTGRRMPFAGAAAGAAARWDACEPVWQGSQPLLSDGAVKRPGDGATVMAFSGRVDAGCVVLAGNELTGTPAPGRAWREQVWSVALPVFGGLALLCVVWMVVALRRSRKHGEDFLPMMLGRLF